MDIRMSKSSMGWLEVDVFTQERDDAECVVDFLEGTNTSCLSVESFNNKERVKLFLSNDMFRHVRDRLNEIYGGTDDGQSN